MVYGAPLYSAKTKKTRDVRAGFKAAPSLAHSGSCSAQEQALATLSHAADNYGDVVFPCALITGDVVILDLLNRLGYLSSGRVPVIFIDTFHLFPETHSFLKSLEVSQPITPPPLDPHSTPMLSTEAHALNNKPADKIAQA